MRAYLRQHAPPPRTTPTWNSDHPTPRSQRPRRRPSRRIEPRPAGDYPRRVQAEQILAFRLVRSGTGQPRRGRPRRGGGLPRLGLRARRGAARPGGAAGGADAETVRRGRRRRRSRRRSIVREAIHALAPEDLALYADLGRRRRAGPAARPAGPAAGGRQGLRPHRRVRGGRRGDQGRPGQRSRVGQERAARRAARAGSPRPDAVVRGVQEPPRRGDAVALRGREGRSTPGLRAPLRLGRPDPAPPATEAVRCFLHFYRPATSGDFAKRLFRPVASPGAVLKDGRLAGLWRVKAKGHKAEITVQRLGPVSAVTSRRRRSASATSATPPRRSWSSTEAVTDALATDRSGGDHRRTAWCFVVEVVMRLPALRGQPRVPRPPLG